MKVLFYGRREYRCSMRLVAEKVWPELPRYCLSEHRNLDETGFSSKFYKIFRALKKQNISIDEINSRQDAIVRCRVLRRLNPEHAVRLLMAVEMTFEELLNNGQVRYILAPPVDSYILHVLAEKAARKKIPYIGVIKTFVDGFSRATVFGESTAVDLVTPAQREAIEIALMSDSYVPRFVKKSLELSQLHVYLRWLQNIFKVPYFYLIRYLRNDLENYHYNARLFTAIDSLALCPKARFDVTSDEQLSQIAAEISSSGKKLVYLPLQKMPECTVDYWAEDKTWLNYGAKLSGYVKSDSSKVYLIKEHPNVVGLRQRSFYKSIECDNVILVSPKLRSVKLIDATDEVLVCTGSAGFEASIRGKRVQCDQGAWYFQPTASQDAGSLSSETNRIASNKRELKVMLDYLARQCIPGELVSDAMLKTENGVHLLNELCLSLRRIYKNA